MSLVKQGLAGQEVGQLLLLNGSKDTQMPIVDLYAAASSLKGGPIETWVNPQGGHMGNDATWPSQRIRAEIVAPWMIRKLKASNQPFKSAEE